MRITVELTPDEWEMVRGAVIDLKESVEASPLVYLDGAKEHLDTLLEKLPIPLSRTKIYLE
jgi:hypothetical protein